MRKGLSGYYFKWVLLCFAVVSLPVILLGIFSYAKSSGVVQQKVSEQKALNLEQTQMNLEHTLKVVDQAATHFFGSKIIAAALNEPLSPEQFQLFTLIKTELNGLQRLDTGISDIYLTSKSNNWLINNDGLFRLDAWTKNHPDTLPEPAAASVWEVNNNSAQAAPAAAANGNEGPPLSENECRISINLIKKLPLTAFRDSGMAMVQIPVCNLVNLFSINAATESLMVFDEKGQIIIREGLMQKELDQSLQPIVNGLLQKRPGSFSLESGRNKYNLTYRTSEYNNWLYISLVTVDQLTKQSREIGWFTLYICLGLLVLFTLLSWYGSGRLYRPIRTIYQDVAAQQNMNYTDKAVDEVQWIGQQIRALFQTKKQLEIRLQGHTEQLRNFFMVKLFLGGMKEEEIVERMDSFGMRKDFTLFSVLALQVGSLQHTRFTEKDLDLLLFAVNNMIGELVPADRRLQPIVLARSQMTILTGNQETPEAFKSEIFAFAQLIQRNVAELLELPVSIGISISHTRLADIPRAYEEAVEALKRRTSFTESMTLFFEDLGENHTIHYAYPYGLQSELFDAVKLVDKDRAQPLLNQIVRELCGSNPNLHDLQFNTIRLLMNLLALANALAGRSIPINQQQLLFDELFELNIPDEGEAWFYSKIIEPLMAVIEEQTEARHLNLAKQLVEMIHVEFDTDLTIDCCAERLHYNASYVSTIFRKSMDISFSGYLAQYRHQVALKWLKETDMPIKHIAERLRYNNPQNFIRSFKKSEGLSPGKYRDMERGLYLEHGGETSGV